jgi:hypothetical protein
MAIFLLIIYFSNYFENTESKYIEYIKYFLLKRSLHQEIQFSIISITSIFVSFFILVKIQSMQAQNSFKSIPVYFIIIYGLLFSVYWFLNGSWIIGIDFTFFIFIGLGYYLIYHHRQSDFENMIVKNVISFLLTMTLISVGNCIFFKREILLNPNIKNILNISNVIKSNTIKGENILILTDKNYLYVFNNSKIAGSFPALTEIVSDKQILDYTQGLVKADKIFIDSLPSYNTGIDIIKSKINIAIYERFNCRIIEFGVKLCVKKVEFNKSN